MSIPIYQIDAFSQVPFAGNPAAVCPLPAWPTEQWMQNVAMENNLSETAFFVRSADRYRIRWFTPTCEVDLCGHATLASAFVLWQYLGEQTDEITFDSASGPLQVTRQGPLLELNFPARTITEHIANTSEAGNAIATALGCSPRWMGHDHRRCLIEATSEQHLAQLEPDMNALMSLPYDVFLVTAKGEEHDFVCRVFAPIKGINEDPVTGSAYTALTPYWAAKLKQTKLNARQLSQRGGSVATQLTGDRVLIAGHAVCVMRGELLV